MKRRRAPLVIAPLLALPPHQLRRAPSDVMGRERSVLGRVPFCGELGIGARQARAKRALWTYATALAAHAHGCGPGVVRILGATPPRAARRSKEDIARGQRSVPGRMPLL